jgi:hypothetical protein
MKKELEGTVKELADMKKERDEMSIRLVIVQRLNVMADMKAGINKKISDQMVQQLNEVTASKIETEMKLKKEMNNNKDLTEKNKQMYIMYKRMNLDAVEYHNDLDDTRKRNAALSHDIVTLNARIRELTDSTRTQIVTLR